MGQNNVECATNPIAKRQSDKGKRAYLSGLAAEQSVIRAYGARGVSVLQSRWRGQGGEIDLILCDPENYVFCEV